MQLISKCLRALSLACAISLASFSAHAQSGGVNAHPSGETAAQRGDWPAARELFTRECESGDAYGCRRIADLHRQGQGGQQDFDKAATAYGEACTLGSAAGCSYLAYLHFKGHGGIDQDHARARALYERACDLGDVSGCAGFGNMVYAGFGGPQDRVLGATKLRAACAAKVVYACDQLRRYGIVQLR